MVLRCGQKPSGEEASISLVYALGLRTDQTHVAEAVDCISSASHNPKDVPKYFDC
jgi:hypothetical protein